ncbi:hypothetical protein Leryth_007906 [Lithospermum erythrorhizon]|nr:hypothetical protein Leryth_007906 [Lithospermum erythrorhizon]
MSFTLDVAEELGVPNVLVWPLSASSAMAYAHFGQLVGKKLVPLPDEKSLTNGYLETAIDWIPGMEGIRLKDFPTMIRITDPNDISFHFSKEAAERSKKASANVLNTFDALEGTFIKNELLNELYANLYSIGPFHLLENHLPENDEVKFFGSSMYKEDNVCLSWLDSKDPDSVILVSFGTTGFLTEEQLVEFVWGLADSPHNFIWIVSATLVGGESSLLPPDFETKIKNRGLLASWCDQEAVLKHPAVGGFLTHCGWNSVLESICAGVPMIFCPTFADQVTNSWFCMNNLEVGLLLDGEINRKKIEGVVGELMVGEKGKKMKQNVHHLKTLAEEACLNIDGSSYKNFKKVVDVLLSKPSDHK